MPSNVIDQIAAKSDATVGRAGLVRVERAIATGNTAAMEEIARHADRAVRDRLRALDGYTPTWFVNNTGLDDDELAALADTFTAHRDINVAKIARRTENRRLAAALVARAGATTIHNLIGATAANPALTGTNATLAGGDITAAAVERWIQLRSGDSDPTATLADTYRVFGARHAAAFTGHLGTATLDAIAALDDSSLDQLAAIPGVWRPLTVALRRHGADAAAAHLESTAICGALRIGDILDELRSVEDLGEVLAVRDTVHRDGGMVLLHQVIDAALDTDIGRNTLHTFIGKSTELAALLAQRSLSARAVARLCETAPVNRHVVLGVADRAGLVSVAAVVAHLRELDLEPRDVARHLEGVLLGRSGDAVATVIAEVPVNVLAHLPADHVIDALDVLLERDPRRWDMFATLAGDGASDVTVADLTRSIGLIETTAA